MDASAPSRSAGTGTRWAPKPFVLWAIALAGCGAAAWSVWLAFASDHVAEPGLQAALIDWITLPYILGGLVAWWRRPDSGFGPLMIAAGFAMFLSSLQWANEAFPYTVGLAFDLIPPALFLHVFLAFPSGRLQRRLERVAVVAAYSAAVGLQLVKMLLGGVGADNLLAVVTEPAAANTVQDVQLIALSALCLAGIALLAARRRGTGRPLRRPVALLVDSFALGLVAIAALLLAGLLELRAFETIRRVTFGVIGIAPVAFLIGLLDARLARSAVGDLVVELRADPAPADLPDAFARALRDPSLTLAYWVPQFETWADLEGRPVELPKPESGRATTFIDLDGAHVAALVHDRSLDDERELLDAVSAAAGIALENGRLQAELRAGLEELRGSRGRVIEAGQKERQRLERNLHDGAQQRLIALSLDLRRLEERLGPDPEAQAGLDRARREIALSLEELRGVARGIHPAVVSGHGLAVALESVAAHAPVPIRLTVEIEGRVHERIEVAAYYVVCESLANIGKHAQATSATVAVARMNGEIVVEVVDDGVGGADSERGTGLRGLADRVEALDGRLRVWTPRGGGTRVRAEMPCA
jgi:signal transduction histidine kinase